MLGCRPERWGLLTDWPLSGLRVPPSSPWLLWMLTMTSKQQSASCCPQGSLGWCHSDPHFTGEEMQSLRRAHQGHCTDAKSQWAAGFPGVPLGSLCTGLSSTAGREGKTCGHVARLPTWGNALGNVPLQRWVRGCSPRTPAPHKLQKGPYVGIWDHALRPCCPPSEGWAIAPSPGREAERGPVFAQTLLLFGTQWPRPSPSSSGRPRMGEA